MWIDEHGVSHSEALAEPTSVFTTEALSWLRSQSPSEIRSAIRRLKTYPESVFEQIANGDWPLEGEREYVQAHPPEYLRMRLEGSMRLDLQVRARIEEMPLRWRAEILFAVLAVLWSIDDAVMVAADET